MPIQHFYFAEQREKQKVNLIIIVFPFPISNVVRLRVPLLREAHYSGEGIDVQNEGHSNLRDSGDSLLSLFQ